MALAVLAGTALWGADVGRSRVTRETLAAMEKSLDARLTDMSLEPPFDPLGTARGVYVQGFGAVFTSELSLILTPALTPFRRSVSKADIARIRQRKLAQLPKLRQVMREFLVASAGSLDTVPATEQIVVAISIFHYRWEDTEGMPEQVVMQAERRILLDLLARRLPESAMETSIRMEEF